MLLFLSNSAKPSSNTTIHNHIDIIMSTYLQNYYQYRSITSIHGTGARCRVCSDNYSTDRHQHSSLCSKHDVKATTEEVLLERIAVRAQDECISHRELEYKEKGIPEVARFAGWTYSEHWIWRTMNMLRTQWEWSLIHLLPFWQAVLDKHDPDCE
jgi:hypothetical protein